MDVPGFDKSPSYVFQTKSGFELSIILICKKTKFVDISDFFRTKFQGTRLSQHSLNMTVGIASFVL